eukprot:TRINITY_DN6478_c0_g1_i1.p1 TRINITY_DN6478_c0_g1~~TRINITY_DN6478_c0_g1_i1.p1  ORF type:complete len:195 (-),score=37.09 TRINITY_DN6478_c0_g1_i1:49-633(-)
MMRLGMSPYIAHLIVSGDLKLAFWMCIGAGLTDVLDGYIAKRIPSQRSVFGSFLDPLADKTLVTFTSVALAYTGLVPSWLVVLMITRDVALVTGAAIYRYRSMPAPVTLARFVDVNHVKTLEIRPLTSSKLNTALQLGLAATAITHGAFAWPPEIALTTLIWGVFGTTWWSGISYLIAGSKLHRLRKQAERKDI